MPPSKDRKKARVAGMEKAKSNTDRDEPKEIGKSQAIQKKNISLHLGSVLRTE